MNSIELDIGKFKTLKGHEKLSHVHGELLMHINGRQVPDLGGACFNQWFEVLGKIINEFENGETEYHFDWGDQGFSDYEFILNSDKTISFSIKENEGMGGEGRADWQNIRFTMDDFKLAYIHLTDRFFDIIKTDYPKILGKWEELTGIKNKTD